MITPSYNVKLLLYPFTIMSKKYSLNEKTYSFIASYMWGVGGVSQTMTQYGRGGDGGPEEAKIVCHNK